MPPRACVGAILGLDEPAYLLYGPAARPPRRVPVGRRRRRPGAYRAGLFYVVISTGPNRYVARQFRSAGWTVGPLGDYWQLAVAPNAAGGECPA